jgi:two-component system OmpR family response regulator
MVFKTNSFLKGSFNLLVIEDEPQIRENLAEILTLKGFDVTTASNGVNGLAQASHQPPDLILCDVMMPGMDGYQFLEKLRQKPSLANVPFIFLTAKATMGDLRHGMTSGADDYLAKPYQMKDLLAAIEGRLKRHYPQNLASGSPTFLKSIRGSDQKGWMTLQTEECLYFFIQNRHYLVRHPQGIFQIVQTIEKLAEELDPKQFFRINRNVILHRKIIQKYSYWEKGKYCIYLSIDGKPQEAILPKARINDFKKWLGGQ